MAARLFTPQLIRRGLEIFLLISLAGFAFTFVYGKNPQAVLDKVLHLHWAWLLVGILLASMDWICARTCLASAFFDWTVGEASAPAAKNEAAARALRSARRNECLGVALIRTA